VVQETNVIATGKHKTIDFFLGNWVVNKKRRGFVATEYREWNLFTVSMVTGEKAGHKIIKKSAKCDKSLILCIFLKNFINLGRIFRDFY